MHDQKPNKARTISARVLAHAVIVMAVEWILLVGGLRRNEMIVGALCVGASAIFMYVVYRAESQALEFSLRDLATCWRIPWYILSGSWEITFILFKDLLSIQRAGSYFRVGGFKTSKHDPLLVTRRVLATTYTTTAPNFIVIGIDVDQSRMLFHQLERSSVPKMTQELGAQP
jgi:hypothetical protein